MFTLTAPMHKHTVGQSPPAHARGGTATSRSLENARTAADMVSSVIASTAVSARVVTGDLCVASMSFDEWRAPAPA